MFTTKFSDIPILEEREMRHFGMHDEHRHRSAAPALRDKAGIEEILRYPINSVPWGLKGGSGLTDRKRN